MLVLKAPCSRPRLVRNRTKWFSSFIGSGICGILLSASAVAEQGEPQVVLSSDGAWCWFQDPRAIYLAGDRERTYTGWVTRGGALQLGAFDHQNGEIESVTLKSNWDADDHNTSSLITLPDRRLMVFYAQHNKTGLYCRTSTEPESILRWDDEVVISGENRITYSHPVYLRAEKKFYVFWRGPSWKPTVATSLDGVSWSKERILIQGEGKQSRSIRPYLKVYSDGESAIHFTFTDGHPRNEPTNSVYYLAYHEGAFFRADGVQVADWEQIPIDHRESDLVYAPSRGSGRAWVWDVAQTASGKPVIAYTRYPSETEHRYHYAHWDGGWIDCEIGDSGRWFPETPAGRVEREPHYSGGLALHPGDPSVVYLSRQVEGQFEIEQWRKAALNCDWNIEAITSGSRQINVRPVVPWGTPAENAIVLWMNGSYEHYTRFRTRILLKP